MISDTTRHDADTIVVRGDAGRELDAAPKQVGRYVVVGELGRGGMGVVYAAWDPNLQRRVAIKTRAIADASSRTRLRSEARALAQLNHPNVVPIYDVVDADDGLVVAMELVEGSTLSAWLRECERPPSEILQALVDAGRGLAAAHAAGLVHRDVKPSNVLIAGDGRVKVADFGLAQWAGVPGEPASGETVSGGSQTGEIAETPGYMSPEQLCGRPLDPRTDQFSYCIVAYEAIFGTRPFPPDIAARIRRGDTVEPAAPLRTVPGVPGRLWPLLRRGLAPDPAQRWESMDALVSRLDALAHRGRRRALPWLAAGAIGVAGLAYASADDEACATDLSVHGVWNPQRADAVRRSIMGTGVPFAPHVAEQVHTSLDTHASAWTDARNQLCATHRPSPGTERCLRDAAVRLDAVVSVLENADAAAVENAPNVVDRLQPPGHCTAGTQREGPEPPAPSLEPDVAQVERMLERARARPKVEAEALLPLAERAREIGYEPLSARVLLALAGARRSEGDTVATRALAQEAYDRAVRARDDATAARAAITQTLSELAAGDSGKAHAWLRHAEAQLERAGYPPELHIRYLLARGHTFDRSGDLPQAETAAREVIELAEAHGAATWHHEGQLFLARVLEARGKYEEAVTLLEGHLEEAREIFGPDHPTYAGTLLNLGNPLSRIGRAEEGTKLLREAIAIFDAEPERLAVQGAISRSDLSNSLRSAGRVEEALEVSEEAVARARKHLDEHHPLLAVMLNVYAVNLKDNRRYAEALAPAEESVAIWTYNDDTGVAAGHLNVGTIAYRLDDLDRAEDAYRKALAVQRASDPNHPRGGDRRAEPVPTRGAARPARRGT